MCVGGCLHMKRERKKTCVEKEEKNQDKPLWPKRKK